MTCGRLLTLFTLFFCLLAYRASAQKTDSLKSDSAHQDFVSKMQAFAKQEAQESIDEFSNDKASIDQAKILEDIKRNIHKAKIYLKGGIDTVGSKAEILLISKDFDAAGDGVFTNKGSAQTFRNLTASSKIITELLNKTLARKAKLEYDRHELQNYHYQLDSLSSNLTLFKFPKDSVNLRKYLRQLLVVAYEAHPVDSVLKQDITNVQNLLTEVNLVAFKLQSGLEEIDLFKKNLAEDAFKRDFDNIWAKEGYARPFDQILSHSLEKAKLTLSFYAQNNEGKLITLVILMAIIVIYLRSLKKIYVENDLISKDFEGQLVLRYPLLSGVLITISIFQFIFISPPFILSVIFWAISCLALSILFKNFITRYWINVWFLTVMLFSISTLDNILLQASRIERWIVLGMTAFGVIAAIAIVWKGNRATLREKWFIYSIALMGVLEFIGLFADIFGRYNLAKSLMISGYLNIVVALLFLWTVRMINEGLFLAYNVYTKQDKKLFYLNFQRVGDRAPAFFYIILILGWVILMGRNFSFYEFSVSPVRDFFSNERTIGDYSFTINNLLLFIVIMGIAVVVSKVVSFFASDHNPTPEKDEKQGIQKLGSWLLLIRISILSMGLFLAVAAIGIPLDRITIVIGALGVGIGFGLQALVNNLVSGLIIAFEKPVNVGDIVDIGGTAGTMKSVGFRSSVISTWEGADVVMPNGDLLSAHLTNWSLSDNKKRISILIGIAYDSDLEKVKQIISGLLDNEDRISKNPHYIVQYEQFSDSTIDLRIYFWTKHMKDSFATRSDLIIAITKAFRTNNIVIPFPQQDIYLHNSNQPE
jgi:potassium-dependent mechanosensitive channel